MSAVLASLLWVGLFAWVWWDCRPLVSRYLARHPAPEAPVLPDPPPGWVLQLAQQQGPDWAQQDFLHLVREAYDKTHDWEKAAVMTQARVEAESQVVLPTGTEGV